MDRIQQLIDQYHLQPHPEGGYFAETWRSTTLVETPLGSRSAGTAIYFLLTQGNFSAFHRIRSDEVWHWHEGAAVEVHMLQEDGSYGRLLLGGDAAAGQSYQGMVPAGAWFASHCVGSPGYALVGCTVSPGFDFADFELAECEMLSARFPAHRELVMRFTR
jgi:predicted cupin superfamily sugar epimerase